MNVLSQKLSVKNNRIDAEISALRQKAKQLQEQLKNLPYEKMSQEDKEERMKLIQQQLEVIMQRIAELQSKKRNAEEEMQGVSACILKRKDSIIDIFS